MSWDVLICNILAICREVLNASSREVLYIMGRHGYLASTLPSCRAVARPHIELEICIKHNILTIFYKIKSLIVLEDQIP